MIKFSALTLRRGVRILFQDADFTIHRAQHVGLTGGNGTGKSSLFALILGELHADSGDLGLPQDLTIAHVAQETPAVDTPAIDYVMAGDQELHEVQQALQEAEAAVDGHIQAELHNRLEQMDGYDARARAARLMHGLGFAVDEDQRPVATFSGGWRMRLNLAQALMCRSDLLLLDEPTNHLDLDAVIWLEDWLRSYQGTLLLISHDRDFLDRVVDHIAHLEQERITLTPGNYSAFEKIRAERLAQQSALYVKQQREIAHMHGFVERFRAKATKARQAQSRLKALARMERIAPAHVDSPFQFEFSAPRVLPNSLLRMEKAAAGYADNAIIRNIDLALLPGDRIGLLGPNGAGKSTLMKLIAGDLAPLSGKRETARDLAVGYFAQHQLEQLDPGASPLLHLRRIDADAPEQKLRDFLGGFGFQGDRVLDPVQPFSGGEKARLVLGLLVWQRPNLLLLDEPTNHLDLEMRHALNIALQGFAGALVLVSHDRHLLRTVTDHLLLVHAGGVGEFDEDLDAYPAWLTRQRRERSVATEQGAVVQTQPNRREIKRQQAEQRQRTQPLRNRERKLEKRVDQLSREKEELEAELADPALYDEAGREHLKKLLLEQSRLARELAHTEAEWLETMNELEDLEQGAS